MVARSATLIASTVSRACSISRRSAASERYVSSVWLIGIGDFAADGITAMLEREPARALCRAINDWLASYCSHDPSRLVGIGTLPMAHPDDALAETLIPGESGKSEAWIVLQADPDSQILVVHEVGHGVMDETYNDAFPSAPNCRSIGLSHSNGLSVEPNAPQFTTLLILNTSPFESSRTSRR